MYGIVEVVSSGRIEAAIVEFRLRHEYGTFATREEAEKVARDLGMQFVARELKVAE